MAQGCLGGRGKSYLLLPRRGSCLAQLVLLSSSMLGCHPPPAARALRSWAYFTELPSSCCALTTVECGTQQALSWAGTTQGFCCYLLPLSRLEPMPKANVISLRTSLPLEHLITARILWSQNVLRVMQSCPNSLPTPKGVWWLWRWCTPRPWDLLTSCQS